MTHLSSLERYPMVSFRLSPRLKSRIEELAEAKDTPRSQVIKEALRTYLRNRAKYA